jgi:hypothetical protein
MAATFIFAILLGWIAVAPACAQSAPVPAATPVVLDHVIAVVNGEVLLESDVREEMRFEVLQPYPVSRGGNTPQVAARRLVSRSLILQQMRDQRITQPPTDEEVDQRIADTRKLLPACAADRCVTDEGWAKFLHDNDLTLDEVRQRLREQLEILKFIEVRFRAGVRVSQQEIQDFYQKTLLPQYGKSKVTPPPIATVSARVEEIVLQEKVNLMLREWLRSLREQGSVQVLDAAYFPAADNESNKGGDE